MDVANGASVTVSPESIPRDKKLKHLSSLPEVDFRDRVVRPLFERRQLKFVRDSCGSDEEGKDCIFVGQDQLGRRIVYVVQTKKGNLNMSRKAASNVVEAATQLKTALATDVVLTDVRSKVKPDKALLCASGQINDTARRHILEQVSDPRVGFFDANDLIPMLDELYPEFWWGIDAQQFPYLRNLKLTLLHASDTIPIRVSHGERTGSAPVSDDSYVTLYAGRALTEVRRHGGRVTTEAKLQQIPVDRLVGQRGKLLLIAGEGGSGKTTALRRMAFKSAEGGLRSASLAAIPVILKAGDVVGSACRLVEVAARATTRIAPSGAVCFTDEDLAGGAVVLLIDALDEVASDEAKASVIERIDEFRQEYGECTVILTSRDYAFLDRLPGLERYTRYDLIPMDLAHALKIVDRVASGRSVPRDALAELLRRLQDVHGMTLSPLLVTVFIASSDFSTKDIPPNITELFKKFTELMLGRWDDKKGLAQQYESGLKDFLLQRVAFVMHAARQTALPLERCQDLIATELDSRGYSANIQQLFDEIVYRSGLLRVGDGVVEFRHHLIQEYFAGRGASLNYLRSVVTDEWWRKPVVFYFGERASRNDELEVLAESVEGRSVMELYDSAVTIGLALQACYLATVDDKVKMLAWVVDALAKSQEAFTSGAEGHVAFPVTRFLAYYIVGRDAVACNQMPLLADATQKQHPSQGADDPAAQLRLFWCIVGLIESGHLEQAEEMVRRFRPSDLRLLLALHLGCFLIAKLRFSTTRQKDAARRICDAVTPKVRGLFADVYREWRGMLLEERGGQIKAIDAPAEERPDTGLA